MTPGSEEHVLYGAQEGYDMEPVEGDAHHAEIIQELAAVGSTSDVPDTTLGSMNAAWHAKHRMPRNATLAQRVRWHMAHEKHCGCRPMPRNVRQAIRSGRPGGSRRRDRAD